MERTGRQTYGRSYIYIARAPVVRLGGLAPARPINYLVTPRSGARDFADQALPPSYVYKCKDQRAFARGGEPGDEAMYSDFPIH